MELRTPSQNQLTAMKIHNSQDNKRTGISKDTIHTILSNHRRRMVLRLLSDKNSMELGEIADKIAAIENNKPVDEITSDERKRVYVGLYQCHCPKMEDMGVIDMDRKTISLTKDARDCVWYLNNGPNPSLTERFKRLLS